MRSKHQHPRCTRSATWQTRGLTVSVAERIIIAILDEVVGELNLETVHVLPNDNDGQASADDPELWGWRTEITQQDEDSITISAYNIQPDGVEQKATEIVYNKK